MFLMFRLLQKHPTHAFIYRHGSASNGFFLCYNNRTWWHPNIRKAFSTLTLKLLTNNGSQPIWAILDGDAAIPTGTPEVRQVVLISPGMQKAPAVNGLLKPGGAALLVNPPWSLDDLESVREHAYINVVDTNDLRQSFERWGRSPRIALDWANDRIQQQKLNDALSITNHEKYFRQAGLVEIDYENVSGCIFHLLPGQRGIPDGVADDDPTLEFSYPAFCCATSWVQDRIWEEMKRNSGERLMLRFMIDTSNISTPRAFAFEPHVFCTLHTVGLYMAE
jgi:hypothetical protein